MDEKERQRQQQRAAWNARIQAAVEEGKRLGITPPDAESGMREERAFECGYFEARTRARGGKACPHQPYSRKERNWLKGYVAGSQDALDNIPWPGVCSDGLTPFDDAHGTTSG